MAQFYDAALSVLLTGRETMAVEPTPPTSESLEFLDRRGDSHLRGELVRTADQITALVPELVGVSLTKLFDDTSITLVASTPGVLRMDAVQYVDGGPCVDSVKLGDVVSVNDSDPLSEEKWSLFAKASAAYGVFSSLSLPLVKNGEIVGSANLYASVADAFDDHIDQIADLVGAWAPGSVKDADLSFSRRRDAVDTSAVLGRRDDLIEHAVVIVQRLKSVTEKRARELLLQSARRAGVRESEVARTIVLFHT
jgi:hypothetical protein